MANLSLWFFYYRSNIYHRIKNLDEISMEETLLDFEVPTPIIDDIKVFPDQDKVVSEDDLVGKPASIVFSQNLLQLTTFLKLPVRCCTYKNIITGERCQGKAPFQVTLKTRGTGVVLEWVSV